MVEHIVHAAFRIGDRRHMIAHVQVFLRHDAVRDQPGHGVVRAAHFGNFQRPGIIVKPAGISHLSARFRIDRRAVQHHFRFRAGFNLVHRALLCDDRFDPRIARLRPKVKFLLRLVRLRQLRVDRIRRVFVRTLP